MRTSSSTLVHPTNHGHDPLGLLHTVPPFARLAPGALAQLGPHLDQLHVPAGTALARAGESAHQVVVVLSGRVAVSSNDRRVDVVGPGTVVGAIPVVARAPHLHDYVTETDAEVLVLNGPAYRWVAPLLVA